MATVNEKLTAIAEPIREVLGTAQLLTLDEMAASIPEVYGKGKSDGNADGQAIGYERGYAAGYAAGKEEDGGGNYDEGYNAGLAEGIEQGKQTEYDRFWDTLQCNGKPFDVQSYFMGRGWTDDTYKPKYPIKATGSCTSLLRANLITDVKVTVDLSQVTAGTHVFAHSQYIRRIPLVIVNENIVYTGWFTNNKALEEVYFGDKDGEQNYIGKSISFASCSKLKAGSVDSTCSHLSPNVTGQTITFNSAVKETWHEAMKNGFGTTTADETWDRLCLEHTNWTFVC